MKSPDQDTGYAGLAARALKADDASAAAISLGDRTADVAAIERALRARARRSARPWLVGVGSAAAAAAVVIAVAWHEMGPASRAGVEQRADQSSSPSQLVSQVVSQDLLIFAIDGAGSSIEVAGRKRPAAISDELAPGARLHVPAAGGLTLALATGTRLRLAGGSSARVVELGGMQRFDLESGTLAAEVAKLGPGRRFIIGTPDAEIEVKGTRFDVSFGPQRSPCEPRVRTRVTVQEGVVTVRHGSAEVRLAAGSHWPECGEPRSSVTPRPARSPLVGAKRPGPTVDQPPPPIEVTRAAEALRASNLAEQNDLFAAALSAGRRGDADEALDWLDQLIVRYPHGQLTDSARAERRRLVEAGAARRRGD